MSCKQKITLADESGNTYCYSGHQDTVIGKAFNGCAKRGITETNFEVHIWNAMTSELLQTYPVNDEDIYLSTDKNWLFQELLIEQSWGCQVEVRLFAIGMEKCTAPCKGVFIKSSCDEFMYWVEYDGNKTYLFTVAEEDQDGNVFGLRKYRIADDGESINKQLVSETSTDELDDYHLKNLFELTMD